MRFDREGFRQYIAAFNARDFDGFTRFYHPDVVLSLGGKRELRGRQGIIDFYTEVMQRCHEKLDIVAVGADENGLAAEVDTEFKALADWPDFIAGPLVPGQSIFLSRLVLYQLKDGLIAGIRSGRSRQPVTGPSTF